MIPILWITGPPGVGKTVVAWEIYRRFERAGVDLAYVDVDQLGMLYPPPEDDPDRHTLKARNVGALRANFAAAGAGSLIVSGVVSRRGPPEDMVGGPRFVASLWVGPDELRARLSQRGRLSVQRRVAVEQPETFDQSDIADAWIDTSGMSVDEVADRLLGELGDWPAAREAHSAADAVGAGAGAQAGGEILWVSGTIGAGKSTVGFRAYLDVLRSGARAAYVDVGQLGFCSTARGDHSLQARNLAALWRNSHDVGARLAVVTGRVFTRADVSLYEQSLPGARISWCRLCVGDAELTRRLLSRRDGGSWPEPGDSLCGRPWGELLEAVRHAVAASKLLDEQDIGLCVDLDGLDVATSAARLLGLARWPPAGHRTQS